MFKNNNDNYDQQQQQQQPLQIPDHLKCGEVYTWLCAGELYAVECKLCEDQPLCPLSEFPQHMEVWHTDWETSTTLNDDDDDEEDKSHLQFTDDEDEKQDDDLNHNDDDHALSPNRSVSGLCQLDDQLQSENITTNYEEHDNLLEPFEQVLIEQDTTIDSAQNSAYFFKDEIEQATAAAAAAAEAKQYDIENKHKQQFTNLGEVLKKRRASSVTKTNNDRDLQYLRELKQSKQKFTVSGSRELQNQFKYFKYQIKRKNYKKILKKYKNVKREFMNIQKLNDNETNNEDRSAASRRNIKKFDKITKTIAYNLRKIQEIRKTKDISYEIVKDRKDLREQDKTESETNETKQLINFKQKFSDHWTNLQESNKKHETKAEHWQDETVTNGIETFKFETPTESIKAERFNKNNTKILQQIHIEEKANETLTNNNETNTLQTKGNITNATITSENATEMLKVVKIVGGKYQAETFLDISSKNNKNVKLNQECSGSETKLVNIDIEQNESKRTENKTKRIKYEATLNENKAELNLNKMEQIKNEIKQNENENETEQNKNDSEQNDIETEQKDNEMKQNDNETEEYEEKVIRNENITHGIKFQAKLGQNKPESSIKETELNKLNEELSKNKTSEYKNKILRSNETENKTISEIFKKPLQIRRNTKNYFKRKFKCRKNRKSQNLEQHESETKINENNIIIKNQKQPPTRHSSCHKEKNGLNKCKNLKSNSKFWPSQSKRILLNYRKSKNKSFNTLKHQISRPPNNAIVQSLRLIRRKDSQFRLKESKYFLEIPYYPAQLTKRKSFCKIREEENISCNSLEDTGVELSESSECLQESALQDPLSTDKRSTRKSLCKITAQEKEDLLFKTSTFKRSASHNMRTSAYEKNKISNSEKDNSPAKESLESDTKGFNMAVEQNSQEGGIGKNSTTFLVNQFFESSENLTDLEQNGVFTSPLNLLPSCREPLSPHSPKTEEEHFEFYEPQEKLNKQHITELIKLYRGHARLWDQSHPDFCEPQICRKSWQQITDQWNEFCKRKFTIAEVRIRISTLCQRFVQERERLALEGELDECAKFPYYEQIKFLEQQKSLQKRRELYEQQNEKILEIYQRFSVLWHVSCYKLRQAKERAQAFESVSQALKSCGLHLSSHGVQKRIRSLRKCYRLEKIRHLHAQVEQTPYQPEFRHYEKMQFLDKHIDPFVCRICGKIFENMQGFREHLEAENHGGILPEECEMENEVNVREHNPNYNKSENFRFSPISSHIEGFSESENSADILQRFTPFSCTPPTNPDAQNSIANVSANNPAHMAQVSSFPFVNPNESGISSDSLSSDQLIEKIMENVTSNDELNETFIDTIKCYEANNCTTAKTISPYILHSENSFIVTHPDIVTQPNRQVFVDDLWCTENFSVVEHPDIKADTAVCVSSPKSNVQADLLQTEDYLSAEHPVTAKDSAPVTNLNQTFEKVLSLSPIVQDFKPIKELNNPEILSNDLANSPSVDPLVLNPQFLNTSQTSAKPSNELNFTSLNESDNEFFSPADISTIPLPDHFIHKMIELYRKFPQLWNPNHLDYNSRKLRRQAWCSLTMEFNSTVAVENPLSWRTLHRKLSDYVKYYKKLITEQENYEHMENKWVFYEDFKFLHDVIAVHTELYRSVHHRDNNFKIIDIYKTLPQLWNIKHPDYNRREFKQRNIELMCNRLQEEHNLQLTTERLKNRLIELRTQYRLGKKQRLKCMTNKQTFSSSDFEFYEVLKFLDDHIDPFICDKCKMEFKKLTDYNQHYKREHGAKPRITLPPYEPGGEHICHICGIKFTARSNLVHHVKRHEGIRNYGCTICLKKFYSSHALKVHIRSHTKECPYTCEKCGISFVSASKLNQHVKRHLSQKDYVCSYCAKAFYTACEKDRHEKRHLNIREKVCPSCGKTFVVGSSYYAHLMLHSGTKRFACDKCDMKFAQYPGLYKHKKRHHT